MEPVQGNRKVTATGSHRRRDRASGLPPAKPPSGPQRLQGSAQREPGGGIRAQNSKVTQVQGGGPPRRAATGQRNISPAVGPAPAGKPWDPCTPAAPLPNRRETPVRAPPPPAPSCRWKALAALLPPPNLPSVKLAAGVEVGTGSHTVSGRLAGQEAL